MTYERAEFKMRMERIRKLRALRLAYQERAQARFEADVEALARKAKPRRKYRDAEGNLNMAKAIDALGAQTYDRHRTAVIAVECRRDKRFMTWIAEHEAKLDELAALIDPQPGEVAVEYARIWESTYRTQGYGARRYALGAAESRADAARRWGIPVSIEECEREAGGVTDFAVTVYVDDEIDAEILRRKPTMSTAEWVQACWQRGVNPRVYNPFLPPDFEAQNGLDYFGGTK